MARYLALALFGEGPTDEEFLAPLIQRVVEDIRIRERLALDAVEPVRYLGSYARRDRGVEWVAEKAIEAVDEYDVLFIHADGDGNWQAAREAHFDRPTSAIGERLDVANRHFVPVIPVRETEAWTLVDGDALNRAFGSNLTERDLALPASPREVERTLDPKARLNEVFRTASGGRKGRRRKKPDDYLQVIANRVALSRLREVPSFRRFEESSREALRGLAIIP